MHTVMWTFKVPAGTSKAQLIRLSNATAHTYEGIPGLIRKYYGITPDGGSLVSALRQLSILLGVLEPPSGAGNVDTASYIVMRMVNTIACRCSRPNWPTLLRKADSSRWSDPSPQNAPRKIRVNVVAPGATKTPIWKRGVRANATAEESAKVSDFFSSTVPFARWGEPEDLAEAVRFLASDDSSYINAVEPMVDGGLTGAPFGAPILRG
jgi:hypothetical protein